MFTLEALEAKHGDSLLLHYGTAADRKLILIDGGPAGVYGGVLSKRLEELRGGGDAPLRLRLVMVSHVDSDHITGVIELFNELKKTKTDGDPLPYLVTELWHNSFKDGLKIAGAALPAEVQAKVKLADLEEGLVPKTFGISEDARVDLASIGQGAKLRDLAKSMGTTTNYGFDPLVMEKNGKYPKVDMGDGLTFRVLGPSEVRLKALKADWAKKTKKKKATPAMLADYLDKSVYNLSSIVVLAEFDKKRMLLTGDARGDDIIAALEGAKMLKEKKTMKVNVLKVPHHGSWRNLDDDFFERILADHYVFSANGTYDNPDTPALKSLIAARGTAKYKIWLTNSVPHALKVVKAAKDGKTQFELKVRDKNALGIEIPL